jgi:hypothetical protein
LWFGKRESEESEGSLRESEHNDMERQGGWFITWLEPTR